MQLTSQQDGQDLSARDTALLERFAQSREDEVTDTAVDAIVGNAMECPSCERHVTHANLRPHARSCDALRADVAAEAAR